MHKTFSILLLLTFFCACSPENDEAVLAGQAQGFLEHALETCTGWEKVHVAEELLSLGCPANIKSEFVEELERYGEIPQYRIGIWRVMAKEAATHEEHKRWVERVIDIYTDTTQSDRLHAAESLAKLNVNLWNLSPSVVLHDLHEGDPVMRAFVSWGTSVSEDKDSVRYERLFELIDSAQETIRKIGAYALCYCINIPDEYRCRLTQKAMSESPESEAKLYLLKAAYLFPAPASSETGVSVKEALLDNFKSFGKSGYYEICMCLAERGAAEDLPFLEKMLHGAFSHETDSTGTDAFSSSDEIYIKASSAYAILRIWQRSDKKMALFDYFILGLYILLMLATGLYYSRKNKNTDDYNLGGRSMNPMLVGLSLFATLMSALSYLSYPGEVIKYGPAYFAGLASFPLVYYLVGWFLIPKFMELKVTSAYEILEVRIGKNVRILATFFFLSLRLLWMATIIYATVVTAIVPVFGIPLRYAPFVCFLMAALTMLYTSMGGLKAVVVTDSIQTVILIAGALLTIFFIAVQLGSFGAIFPMAAPAHWKKVVWGIDSTSRVTVGNAFLTTFVWYICTAGSDQMAIQRYMATKDLKSARKTFRISIITNFLVQVLLILVGLALLAYFTKRPYELPAGQTVSTYADSLFPRFIVIGLPVGITGLVIAGLISAAMSSLSSGLNSSSAVVTEDIVKRWSHHREEVSLNQVRLLSFIIGMLVTLLCFAIGYVQGNLLEVVIKVVNLFVVPLFVLFFMALLVPFARQKATMIAGLVSAVIAILIAFFEAFGLGMLWIMPVSFVAGIASGILLSLFETKFNPF